MPPAERTGGNRWRWGIVGPGGMAERFATDLALVPDAALVAVSSRSVERARAFAGRHDIDRAYGDRDALLADAEVDVVYVATPHSLHAVDAIAALEAGKHVLCEKPLAISAREAREMAAAARRSGRFLMEAMWTRFLPSYRRLVDVLDEGRIGEPLVVEADFGFRAEVDPTHRLFAPSLGGGSILDLGIYPVHLCALVLGAPERVVADGVLGSTGVDETAAALLHHPGGRMGVVKSSIRVGLSCTARISGSEGWIDLPAFMHCPSHLDVLGRAGHERMDLAHEGDGVRFQVHEVHRCLEAGERESPVMPLSESIGILTVLDSMRAAIGVTYPGEVAAPPT